MGTITIKIPQNIQKEYEIGNSEIIEELLRYLSQIELKQSEIAQKNDILLGLFSDEPDLIDEITEAAMQSRQNPLRYEHE